MNLKTFHAVFIAFAIALLLFVGWLQWQAYRATDVDETRRFAMYFFGAAGALALYEAWFFWKTRRIVIR